MGIGDVEEEMEEELASWFESCPWWWFVVPLLALAALGLWWLGWPWIKSFLLALLEFLKTRAGIITLIAVIILTLIILYYLCAGPAEDEYEEGVGQPGQEPGAYGEGQEGRKPGEGPPGYGEEGGLGEGAPGYGEGGPGEEGAPGYGNGAPGEEGAPGYGPSRAGGLSRAGGPSSAGSLPGTEGPPGGGVPGEEGFGEGADAGEEGGAAVTGASAAKRPKEYFKITYEEDITEEMWTQYKERQQKFYVIDEGLAMGGSARQEGDASNVSLRKGI